MEKDQIKLLIAEYQQIVIDMRLLIREYTLEPKANYVFVGLRRAGKSYLMYQIIKQLLNDGHTKDEILYFNFEDERLTDLTTADLDLIKTCYEEMYDTKPIFFLDEIQNVAYWEKFVRRLADQGYRVYVTGSNAKMLSSDIANTLGGRFMIQHIYPFSFVEYLSSKGIDSRSKNAIYTERSAIVKTFQDYFIYGGLPEISNVNDKRNWLSSLYQKLFYGDLISRYQIRNDFALKLLIRKLAQSVKQATSFTRLANLVSSAGKKISTDTLIDYVGYLIESWMIFGIENINAKLANKASNKKYYFIDNGLLHLFLIDPNTSLLENIVAIALQRKYGNDLYYYQNGVEVDFYIPSEQLAVQVCYSLDDANTLKREVNALMKLHHQLSISKMVIITKDNNQQIVLDGCSIEVVEVWRWLLELDQPQTEKNVFLQSKIN